MSAWVRPITYSLQNGADRGIILNKESSYEMGLEKANHPNEYQTLAGRG